MKPDVIHSHLFDDSLASMIAGKLVGIKKRIVTKGDTGFHYNYKRQWVIFDKIINLLATRIVSISSESQKFIIEKEKANANKVVLIHHGLPLIKTTLQIEEIKNKFIGQWNLKNKIVIGTISRFIDWKGYRNIVNAAEVIVRKHPNAIFLFVGEGEKKKEIIEIVTSKKLSQNIVFSDWINPDYIPSLFGVMNIFLHAAKYEPFGLVIAEAMLNGVPVVATKTGAALDAIDHLETGYLCDYDSINDIQEGLEFMILDMKNPKIGENGKIKAEKLFAIEVMYENHLKIYN
jgi:glycosyltransferase involved in cell wall biosynthesis